MEKTLQALYGAYLLWLLAGLIDFWCHRRTDLSHTSGIAESGLHFLQLAILGSAIALAMAMEPSEALVWCLAVLTAAHAVAGYLDTSVAFSRRRVSLPLEQHVHSVLDMAPPMAFAIYIWMTWPSAMDGAFGFKLREESLSARWWLAVLAPATLLCVLPAALEFQDAWRARKPGDVTSNSRARHSVLQLEGDNSIE